MNKKIVSIIIATIICAGISYSGECETSQLRLQQVIEETKITPEDGRYVRVEVIVINNRMFVAFNNRTTQTFQFQLVELNEDLSHESPVIDIFSDSSDDHRPTDIRLASDGINLWYAFESVDPMQTPPFTCDNKFLNIAKYDISSYEPILMNYKTDIARGCHGGVEGYQNTPPDVIPENPEVVDDPVPIFHNGKYIVLTRAWKGAVQHIRTFDKGFNLIDLYLFPSSLFSVRLSICDSMTSSPNSTTYKRRFPELCLEAR